MREKRGIADQAVPLRKKGNGGRAAASYIEDVGGRQPRQSRTEISCRARDMRLAAARPAPYPSIDTRLTSLPAKPSTKVSCAWCLRLWSRKGRIFCECTPILRSHLRASDACLDRKLAKYTASLNKVLVQQTINKLVLLVRDVLDKLRDNRKIR